MATLELEEPAQKAWLARNAEGSEAPLWTEASMPSWRDEDAKTERRPEAQAPGRP